MDHLPLLGYASASGEPGKRLAEELMHQSEEIAAGCEQRGLLLLEVVRERGSRGTHSLERPGLSQALGRITAGDAAGLVVSDLASISDSVRELGRVLEWLTDRGFRFVALASGVDTAEPAGTAAVQAIIEVSQWEHQRLVERTREGMLVARRKGPRRVADDPELRERIARMRDGGMTLQAIADQLNAEKIPTVRGGAKWRPSSVQAAAGYRRPSTGPPGVRTGSDT